MNNEILNVLIERLKVINPEKTSDLHVDNAASVKLKSFKLDSLDTLQLAMELEDALGLEIEIVDFSDDATLVDIANQLGKLKKRN